MEDFFCWNRINFFLDCRNRFLFAPGTNVELTCEDETFSVMVVLVSLGEIRTEIVESMINITVLEFNNEN